MVKLIDTDAAYIPATNSLRDRMTKAVYEASRTLENVLRDSREEGGAGKREIQEAQLAVNLTETQRALAYRSRKGFWKPSKSHFTKN